MDAFKIEDIYPQTLETKTTYKKDEEPIETIRQENIVLPSYSYGRSQEPLDYETQIRNKPAAATSLIFSGTVTYSTTGVKTVSGVGFTPVLIRIHACLATGSISEGVYFNGAETCNYYFTGAGAGDASGNVGYSAYLDNAGNNTISTTVTPTSDGFTINVTTVAGGAVTIIYECYG